MRIRNWTLALMLAGGSAVTGFTIAEVTAAPASQPAVPSTGECLQHIRAARKLINQAKVMFDKDPVDKANHRKEALAGIDMAIKGLDDEAAEYKAELKE